MKYESITKTDRNREVFRLWNMNPTWSLQEIGDRFGITGQRVGQIVKRELRRQEEAKSVRVQ